MLDPRQANQPISALHFFNPQQMFLLRKTLIAQGEKRETSTKTCNETMLCDKLRVFISRISPPLLRSGTFRAIALFPLNALTKARDICFSRNLPGIMTNVRPAPGPDGRRGTSYEFLGRKKSFIYFPNNGKLDAKNSITILAWVNSQARGPIFHFHPRLGVCTFGWLAQIQYLCVSQCVEHGTSPLLWQAKLSREEGCSLLERLYINQR